MPKSDTEIILQAVERKAVKTLKKIFEEVRDALKEKPKPTKKP